MGVRWGISSSLNAFSQLVGLLLGWLSGLISAWMGTCGFYGHSVSIFVHKITKIVLIEIFLETEKIVTALLLFMVGPYPYAQKVNSLLLAHMFRHGSVFCRHWTDAGVKATLDLEHRMAIRGATVAGGKQFMPLADDELKDSFDTCQSIV